MISEMAPTVKKAEGDPVAQLQQRGYRLTPQRMMVLEAMRNSDGHTSAEEICARVRASYPYANISTIYRTLELLKKLDLVTETDVGEGKARYHYVDKSRHHHLICQKCGLVIDTADSDMASLVDMLRRKYGFHADLKHLAIFGRCGKCAR